MMMTRGIGMLAILLVSVLSLGACATSQFNGYMSAGPADEKVVQAGGYSEAVVAQIAIVQNPDFNSGRISPRALRKIQEYSISCQRQVDAQLAGGVRSAINGAIPYGAAGLGTGPAAALAFAGAKVSEYAIYGGGAYLLPGAINGLVTGSYALASAKGTCTRDFWEDIVKSDPEFIGTHIVVAYAGKTGRSVPPALERSEYERLMAPPPPPEPSIKNAPKGPGYSVVETKPLPLIRRQQ